MILKVTRVEVHKFQVNIKNLSSSEHWPTLPLVHCGRAPSPDCPLRPSSPIGNEPDEGKKDNYVQPTDKNEDRLSPPLHTGDNDEHGRNDTSSTEKPASPLSQATSLDRPASGQPAGPESLCQIPLDSGTASPEDSKTTDTEEKTVVAEEADENSRLEKQESPDETVSDEVLLENPPNVPECEEESMPSEPPASPAPEQNSVRDEPPESPGPHSPMMSIDNDAESYRKEQSEPEHPCIEESVDGELKSPDPNARSDEKSPVSPNAGFESPQSKPSEYPDAAVEDPGEPTKSPERSDSNFCDSIIHKQETNLSYSQETEVRKHDDDQEARSPFPCLENLEDSMPVVPRSSSHGFQEQREYQEGGRLSDGSSCDGDGRRSLGRNSDEITQEPGDDSRPSLSRPAVSSRRMSNCSDLSDDSDSDQYNKRDSKIQSPDHVDSDGDPSSVRCGQVYGKPYSPEMPEQGRYSQQDDRLQTRLDVNGSRPVSPNEEISSDSANFNSSAERLREHPGRPNRSEEEKDGLVEITDEEMSNYEKTWEMEKKLVENTELEGLEAISDVESSGHKSVKSDDGENSGLERLEDGLETISDLEAEGPKTDGLETISDLEPEGPKTEEQEEDEDTPKHQPSVPDDTPEDTQIEEEGEIRDDDAPVPWKKITSLTKERSYRGMKEPAKEISKEIVSKERDRRVELDRHDSRISSSDRGRKKRDDSSSTSSSDSRSRGEDERSVSRVKRKRSSSRTRSRDRERDRTRSRDRARDRTRSRDRDRDLLRSRDRGRDKSIDRTKDRSRSRISRDRYRRDRSRDRRSRSRDRKRRRTRSPRKDKSRSRDRSRRSRDRKRSKRSPSVSSSSDCSSCSCSSCEREETRRQKRKDRRDSKDRDRSKDKDKSKKDRSPRSKKRRTPGPSKEVFTSGDNILVSVNFKKDGEGNKAKETPPAERKRERKKDEKEKPRKDRKESKENKPLKRKDSPRKSRKKKKIDTSNMKTVAIIDLDTSPFRVTTPANELIILSDSDGEEKTSKVDPRMGPRTPPEPQMKFTLAAKKQQVRNMANPLLTMERDVPREDDLSHAHRGPNTPPEPEIRSPYDPFEPTKSPTPEDARGRQSPNQEPNQQVPQVSLTPPRARPQHVAPATPSPLHSPPSTLEQQDRPKLMPFQPVPVDSGDDSPGGGGGGDSPYSPGSSEGDDLFDPPQQLPPPKQKPRVPLPLPLREHPSKHAAPPPKNRPNNAQKDASQKGSSKKDGGIRIDENQQKLLDDLPNSAVEMQFIEKLHRQERVVEEVKLILKPHYAKKHVNKDEYKEILRRAVPKICHSRTGEINPMKIQKLIDAYVQRFRHKRKLAAGGGNPGPNPNPVQRQGKPVVIK